MRAARRNNANNNYGYITRNENALNYRDVEYAYGGARRSSRRTMSARRRAAMIRRRRMQMIRWMLVIAASVLTLSFLLALCFGKRVNAESDSAVTYYKYYRCQEVEDGDTLWAYAGEYRCVEQGQSKQSYISEVMSINHMQDDHIREGQKIVLPYYSTEYVE